MKWIIVALITCSLAPTAHADEAQQGGDRYWLRLVLTDATVPILFVATGFSCFEGCTDATYVMGTATLLAYLAVPTAMHVGRGNRRNAVRSLALRAGLPLLGATVGAGIAPSSSAAGGLFLLGAGAAVVTDWILARDPITPYVAPHEQGGAIVGVAARF